MIDAAELGIALRDELLNREIFTTLTEAKVLIADRRKEYNHVRPHSGLIAPISKEYGLNFFISPLNLSTILMYSYHPMIAAFFD